MKKMLFIINPVSGKLVLNDCLMEVIEIFSKGDYEINVRLTKSREDMIDVAKTAANYDTVVCCGGDGTLNIVAGAIYEGKDPKQIFIRSDAGKAMLIKSSIIPIKSTRSSQGVAVMQLPK